MEVIQWCAIFAFVKTSAKSDTLCFLPAINAAEIDTIKVRLEYRAYKQGKQST